MAIYMILKQFYDFRTSLFLPHLGTRHPLAVFRHQHFGIEGVGVGRQFVIVGMLAHVLIVRLATFTGLPHTHFRQHVGIVGCCHLTEAVHSCAVHAAKHSHSAARLGIGRCEYHR